MRLICSQIAYAILATAVLGGCAKNTIPAPERPTLNGQMAAPMMPPRVIAMPTQPMSGAPGAVKAIPHEEEVDDNRVYKVSVGVGGGTNGPQQAALELPVGEHINAIHWANPTLLNVTAGQIGSPRGGRAVVLFKPLTNVAPRVEEVSILTTQRHLRVDVHVKSGRVKNSTLRLKAAKGASTKGMGRGINAEALCVDNNFTWNKDMWWAPTKVCGLATPEGTYQTLISFPLNIQKMPSIVAFSHYGDNEARPEIVNFRVGENRQMYVDNIWPVLRLNGDAGSVDIYRGGSQ